MTLNDLCRRSLQLNDTFTQPYRELDDLLRNEYRLIQEECSAFMSVQVDIIA